MLYPTKQKNLASDCQLFFLYVLAYYVLLLLFLTVITYVCGLLLERTPQKEGSSSSLECVTLNIGLVIYFKYSEFLLSNVNYVLKLLGWKAMNIKIDVLLPLGISFYTFQELSYIIDVYYAKIAAEKNFVNKKQGEWFACTGGQCDRVDQSHGIYGGRF